MERKIELTMKCPVCGNLVFEEDDDYDICPYCGWENCGLQNERPDFSGGANVMSLNQAREAWKNGKPVR